jgi:hypothetical protein
MTFDRDLDPSKLSDRELLITLYSGMREVCKELSDHESRLRSVEKWRYALGGAIILLAFAVKLYIH